MRKSLLMTPLAAFTFLLAASLPASAGSVSFDFNALAQQSGGTNGVANTAAIQSYMNGVLGLQGSVVVGPGAIADRSYDGEGYVVGATTSVAAAKYQAVTLGTSDGAATSARTTSGGVSCNAGGCTGNTDTFIRNDSFGSPAGNAWSFTFAGWVTITSVSFDYEIFPEAGNAPDFTFSTNLGTVAGWPKLGLVPGSGGAASPNTVSFNSTAELNKQLIGTGTWATPGVGVNQLNFIDWPATIGIDNLTVNFTTTNTVPEPSTMLLLGSGLVAFYARRKKRKA